MYLHYSSIFQQDCQAQIVQTPVEQQKNNGGELRQANCLSSSRAKYDAYISD